jgi:N6-adenosine-specific RNA methylase IME4
VTHGWIEQKHQENFYPIVCHYTTKKEQEFAKSDEKYSNLIRNTDALMQEIDPYSTMEAQSIDHLPPEMIEALAEDKPIIASDVWADLNPGFDDEYGS